MAARGFLLVVSLLVAGSAFAAFCDALDFGFSPDASGTENSAALQRALDCGGTVTVGRPGGYKVAGTVYIGDDTSLVCGSGVVFVKTDEHGKLTNARKRKGPMPMWMVW